MCLKLIEKNVPTGIRVKVHHYHCGNSSNHARHGKEYMTSAWLLNSEDVVVGRGKAYCSRQDNPCRATGRQVAIGRALKDYMVNSIPPETIIN